jgi:uncharacterized protein (TIGR02646 family)
VIYVDRNRVQEPASLRSARAEKIRAEMRHMLGSGSKSLLAQSRVKFDQRIWIDVKPTLKALFHGKCAYCESSLHATAIGDVEHFRPKQISGDGRDEREHLYYAWLAYEWHNLLYACQICNSSKGAAFPVTGQRARWLSSVGDCRKLELGTLIDPCHDKPSDHLGFDDTGHCFPRTDRGAVTVSVLKLNREELVRARKLAIDGTSLLLNSLAVGALQQEAARVALVNLSNAAGDAAPYAAAVRDHLHTTLRRLLDQPGLSAQARRSLQSLQGRLPGSDARASSPTEIKSAPSVAVKSPAATADNRRLRLPRLGMQRLSRVEIENFKAIEHLAFDLPRPPEEAGDQGPTLVLLGENAAGKSSVLEAIALALLGTEQISRLGLDGRRFIRRDAHWEPLGRPARVRLFFDGTDNAAVTLSIDPVSGAFKGRAKPQAVLLGYGPRRYFDAKVKRRSPQPHARLATLFDPTVTLAAPTTWLTRATKSDFNAAIRALRQVLLLPDDALVRRHRGRLGEPDRVAVVLYGTATPIERLSDGYRTVVATVVDVMRELLKYWPNLELAHGVVLVDELDTQLHPRWKMRILQRLRAALPKVQFIATTHDPLCLRGAFDGEVQVLVRDEAGTVERLQDLPNVQGLSVEQLLTSDFFGLMSTEDPAVERDIARYAELAAQPIRSPEEQAELDRLRQSNQRRIKLGLQPREQLIVESAAEFVRQQARVRPDDRRVLSERARQRLAQMWSQITDGTGTP